MNADLEAQLRDLLDRQAIWAVIQRMARGLDRVDNDLVLSCYWPEAIDDHNHYVGPPEGFVAYADKTTLAFESCLHMLGTHNCDLAGDEAHCETYYIYTAIAPAPPHFMSTGRYCDHFEKRGDEWRILNRVTIVDGTFDIAPSAATAGMPSAYPPGEKPVSRDKGDVSYQRPLKVRQPQG